MSLNTLGREKKIQLNLTEICVKLSGGYFCYSYEGLFVEDKVIRISVNSFASHRKI